MCTVAPGMGSAWESNIARLIVQANETLSSSAYARHRSGGERTLSPRRRHRTGACDALPPRPASSSTFRGDRGASYRRGSEGWDASLLIRERAGHGGAGGEGLRMPPPAPAAGAAPLSRLTAARVDGARIDGMEERIKLEVQTVVRRDVNQRVSLSERAAEAVRQRIDGLAEEVANLGDIVRRSNASTETALGQLLAGEERNRTAITHLEAWRADREGWCVRKSDSLDSLTEDMRSLARRTHAQQKVLDHTVDAQEDLASSMKAARKVGEVASASAVAPIREHFLKEIEAIRRRLMALEDGATASASTAVSVAMSTAIKSIAEEEASAKTEEVWRKVKTFVREGMAEQAKDTSDATVATARRVDLHFTEVKQRVDAYGSALETLQKTDKATSQGMVEVRDMMSALRSRLADGLARVDKELHDLRSQGARHETATEAAATTTAVVEQNVCSLGKKYSHRSMSEGLDRAKAAAAAASDNVAGNEDWSAVMSRITELERLRELASPSDLAIGAVVAPSTTSAQEKIENVADKVQRLESGAVAASRRLTAFEDSLDEANETIKGHTLKLRCLEGLWREVGSTKTANELTENDCSPSDDSGGESTGGGSAACNSVQKCHESQPQKQHQQPDVAGTAERKRAVSASTPPVLRTGLSGLLKRLGSNPLSSNQKEVAAKATGHGKDAELSAPPPSCGVMITEPGQQSAPRSDAPDTSTRRLGAGHDGVAEAAPLLAQAPRDHDKRVTEGAAGEGRGSRRRHMSDEDDVNNATGDGCSGAGDQSLGGSSMYDVNFRGEPQEPSTPDRRDERHCAAEAGDSESPDGNDNAGGELTATQQEDGPKRTEGVLSMQQATSGDVNSENGDISLQVQADSSRQILSRAAVPSVATVANATAATTPTATLTSTLTTHPAGEGIKPAMLSAATAGPATTSAAATGLPAARELEESGGSIEGDSAHSRWSLPETRGIGGIGAAGGLHEQRAVWVGGMEDDSVGTVEQAASSVESGGAGRDKDDRSPSRSRVESYDLQRESGGDFMVPFSPDRSTVASDPAESPKGSPKKQPDAEMSRVTVTTSEKADPPETAAADKEGGARELVAPAAHAGGPASALEIAISRPEDSGGGDEGRLEDGSALKEFCFSDDDEEEEEEESGGTGRGTATPEHFSQHTTPPEARLINETEGDGGDGGRNFDRGEFDEEQSGSCSPRSSTRGDDAVRERTPVGSRQRRQHNKGRDRGPDGHGSSSDDSLSDDDSGSESAGEATGRRDRREALLNPLRSVLGRRTSPPGGERGVVDSACATPAAGTWATPDFAFSSDDDLDIEFSASERSVERPVERQSPTSPGTGKGGT